MTPELLKRIAASTAAIVLSTTPLCAQGYQVTPTGFLGVPPGGRDYINVKNVFGCTSTITATTRDPNVAQVFATDAMGNPDPSGDGVTATVTTAIEQDFQIVGVADGVTVIDICWIGDGPPPNCTENNCDPFEPHEVTIDVDDDFSQGQLLQSGNTNDPINTFTGELFLPTVPLLDLGGPLPVRIGLYYGSLLEAEGNVPTLQGHMGPNWAHTYQWKMVNKGPVLEFFAPTGRVIRFERNITGGAYSLVLPKDVAYGLTTLGGSIFVLSDPDSGLAYTFNGTGRLGSIADGKNNVLSVQYAGARINYVRDASSLGRRITFGYDTGGRVTSLTDGTRTVGFTYDASGRLASITDAEGEITNCQYEAATALLTALLRPEGDAPFTQVFATGGEVTEQTDAFANTYGLDYDFASGTTIVSDPIGNARVHVHDDRGRLETFRDESGAEVRMQYDESGRRVQIVDREGGVTSLGYDPASGRLSTVTEADGSTRQVRYAQRTSGAGGVFWDPVEATHADGTTEQFVRDNLGNVLEWTDRAGNASSFTYDVRGMPLTATNAAGGTFEYTYYGDETLRTATDPSGNTTLFTNDVLRRPTRATFADGSATEVVYDNQDRIVTRRDELGNETHLSYDGNGNLEQVLDATGQTFSMDYDAMDRAARRTDPLGNTVVRTFDSLGRLATESDGEGNVTSFGYDPVGNRDTVIDGEGHVSTATYNKEGILTSETDPLGNTTAWLPDSMGRTVQRTSPLGNVVAAAYDSMGRVIRTTDAAGESTDYAYEARGLLSAWSHTSSGISAGYAYDSLGNLVRANDPGGHDWDFVFDNQSRLQSEADPLGNTKIYEYDVRNRVSRMTLPGPGASVDFTYDAASRLVARDYSDGTSLSYAYDAVDQLTSATGMSFSYDAARRMVDSNGIQIAYDAANRITQIVLAPGKALSYTHDGRGLVSSITDWLGGVTRLDYDAAGRLIRIERPNGVTTSMTYDADDRVIGIAEGSLSSIDLVRDARGFVAFAARNTPAAGASSIDSESYTYDAASQLSSSVYDGSGRVVDDGTRTYDWDGASRLAELSDGTDSWSFTHDALGQLLSRSDGSSVDGFVWNRALGLPSPAVLRRDGVDAWYAVHTPVGALVYLVNAATGERFFFHYDEAGNALFTTDDAGAVANSYAYTPYGRLLARNESHANPFTFGALWSVLELHEGLHWMRARVYDSATRRFLERDPLEQLDPRNLNRYLYARANPLRFVDPTGLSPDDAARTDILIRFNDPLRTDLEGSTSVIDSAGIDDDVGAAGSDANLLVIPWDSAQRESTSGTFLQTRSSHDRVQTFGERNPSHEHPTGGGTPTEEDLAALLGKPGPDPFKRCNAAFLGGAECDCDGQAYDCPERARRAATEEAERKFFEQIMGARP